MPDQRVRISLDDVAAGARLLAGLPGFLRNPVKPEQTREIVRQRLERREADFLSFMQDCVYGHERSPYRRLLALAGCEYGDLERLVRAEGVEGALTTLCRQGVYLTLDEFKGRRTAVRGGATVTVHPAQLTNPRVPVHAMIQSTGSRGNSTVGGINLPNAWDQAVNLGLYYDIRGGRRWMHGLWGVPGSATLRVLLHHCGFGGYPVRWFSHVDPGAPGLHPRYRWSSQVTRWASLLAGTPLPRPVHTPLDASLTVARWMADVLRQGGVPNLYTYATSAVRLCYAAGEAGIDLQGAHFTIGGEPITAACLAVIHRAGARAGSRYASVEPGQIAYGCLAPADADDHHLLTDLHALIQIERGHEVPGLPAGALLISTLRRTSPFVLLNVSLGDQCILSQRQCGCPLERLGWTTHLRKIRSYEKLTAGGMMFSDVDVITVLEEILPARFGGGPTHYQLVEEEGDDGQPRLRLLVHPAVGPVDLGAVADAFLSAIGQGSGPERVMASLWRRAGYLRVERQAPLVASSGKILHVHQDRPAVVRS